MGPRIREGVNLSRRQVEVLALVAHGFTDGQIAERLDVKLLTAVTHVRLVREALGATNRAHAVYLGMCAGFITTSEPS